MMGIKTPLKARRRASRSDARPLEKAVDFYLSLQRPDGSFNSDYGGSLFLTPMYVCITTMIGMEPDRETRQGIRKYLLGKQNADHSFGLHIEGEGTVFVTTLAYVALRILGVSQDDPRLTAALRWIDRHGGPTGSAAWGKFVLALLGLYDYRGLNPVLPELWLLPDISPMHPGKMWNHARVVYLPMAYLYAKRITAEESLLLARIRDELYHGQYDDIDWEAKRQNVAPTDVYKPTHPVMKAGNKVMGWYEKLAAGMLRRKALARVLDHIRHEDDTTDFIDLGPVNKLLNTACEWAVDPSSERFGKAAARLPEYLWREEEDGIRMNGYNSIQFWDTAFTVQAVIATGRWESCAKPLRRMNAFIRENQVKEDVDQREKYYRDPSRGGWPFSDLAHGWPITDCTSEGFKAATLLAGLKLPGGEPLIPEDERIGEDMLKAAIDLLLFMQSDDGGWATYEKRRGGAWYEVFNPSNIFADIMTDYSYVECTSACIQALSACLLEFRGWKEEEILKAIERGKAFILSMQRQDGSWEGSWGVCFTYGTWFALWGLRAAGLPPWHEAIARAMRFLLSVQDDDGGWGEHYTSCTTSRYVRSARSQPAMTAWAVLGLMAGSGMWHPRSALVDRTPAYHAGDDAMLIHACVERGVEFLRRTQEKDGDWRQEAIAGVFNKTCMITYDNYRRYFPIWALGIYENRE